MVPWHIGIHRHEHGKDQRVRLNSELAVAEPPRPDADDYTAVVCYERIVDGVRKLAAQGHVKLVETLAHQIAALCLADPRVEVAIVRVEKLDVFADPASVGIAITRTRAAITPAAAERALRPVSGACSPPPLPTR